MSDKKKRNPFQGIVNYFKEVRAELKKVVWPTLKQIQNNTIIVIICLLFVGAIIWALDLGFGSTLGTVIDLAKSPEQTQTMTDGAVPNAIDENELTPEQMDELNNQMQQQQAEEESDQSPSEQENGQ